MITASDDCTVRIWDAETGAARRCRSSQRRERRPATPRITAAAGGAPLEAVRFLLGSEAAMAARRGRAPDPPLPWLADTPPADRIWRGCGQTTAERQVARAWLGGRSARSAPTRTPQG